MNEERKHGWAAQGIDVNFGGMSDDFAYQHELARQERDELEMIPEKIRDMADDLANSGRISDLQEVLDYIDGRLKLKLEGIAQHRGPTTTYSCEKEG